ncbi:MAG: YdcF family protein [Pseudomonadota bacterium]|nr:YdcF family protein [Pseudomonadota bacterium]
MRPHRYLLAALLVLLAHAGWLVSDGLADDPRPADVAVVLGTTANPDGTLSERLEARTAAALVLYEDQLVRRILVSGATGAEGVNEADAMADWLVAQGVPRRHVLVDPEGWNTWETALHTRALLDDAGLSTVVAVTSYYHLPRTRMALTRAGVDVVGTRRADLLWEPREAWSILREVAALYAYALRDRA